MASYPDDPDDYPYHRIIFYDSDQSPKRKTVYLKKSSHYGKEGYTKSEAQEWKKRREIKFKDGEWSPWDETKTKQRGSMVTIKDAINGYSTIAKQELADSTYQVRINYLDEFCDFAGNRPIRKVTSDILNDWINHSGKYNTKRKRKSCLSQLFEYLLEAELIDDKPNMKVIATKAQRKQAKTGYKTYVKPSEFETVKNAARAIHKENVSTNIGGSPKFRKYRQFEKEFPYVFDFLINTAIRKNDLLHLNTEWFLPGLKYMDIGDDEYLPKAKQVERIPLTPEARVIAKRWIDNYGQPARPFIDITPDWYTKFFKRVFRKALPKKSDKLSAHKMRDTAAMYLLHEKGYSPQTVQQITRHEELSTLMIYLHRNPQSALQEIENKG